MSVPFNLPNTLTVTRILLVPVVVVALLAGTPEGSVIAGVVFALAALTDGADGYLARSRHDVTTFGKVMDPVADKVLVIAALAALVSLDRLAAWVAIVIVARELTVSGLRLYAGQQGVIITASSLGKAKTVTQVAMVLGLIAAPDPSVAWVQALVFATVGITVLSGADYLLSARRRIDEGRRAAVS